MTLPAFVFDALWATGAEEVRVDVDQVAADGRIISHDFSLHTHAGLSYPWGLVDAHLVALGDGTVHVYDDGTLAPGPWPR